MKFKKIASLTLSIAMVAAMATTNISALNTEDNGTVICSQVFKRDEYYKNKFKENNLFYYPEVEASSDFRTDDLMKIMGENITNYPTVQENGNYNNYVDFSHLHIPATQENCNTIVETYWIYLDENPRSFNVKGDVAVLKEYNPELQRWEYTSIKEFFWDKETAVIAGKERKFDEKSAEIVREASKFKTDLEKALYVHDNLVANTAYTDNVIFDANGKPIHDENTHDAYGCIVKGECVCQGYSEGYLHIMQLLNIDTKKVTSYHMMHAWDMVKLDGKWHYLDVTWDDPGDYETRTGYRYFLKGEEGFNHSGNDWFAGFITLSGTDLVSEYKGEAFWKNTRCLMPYDDGKWFCHTQDKTGIQTYDVSTGKYENIVNGEDLAWDAEYGQPNFSNMFIADDRLYYSTETEVKSVKLDGSDKTVEYTLTPDEMRAGTIYTLIQEGNQAKIEVMARNDKKPVKTTYFDLNKSAEPTPVPSEYDAWDSSKAYNGGAKVSYNGKNYKAKWWTQGNIPSSSDVWMEISSTNPTPNPDPKPDPKPNPTPNPDPKPDPKPNPTPNPDPNPNPVKYEEWKSSKAYNGGAKVSYNGRNYKAKWWTQGNIPSTSDVWVVF